jgi:hypothetical protein
MASSDPLSCLTPAERRDMLARKIIRECLRVSSKSPSSVIHVPLLKCRFWELSHAAGDFESHVEFIEFAIGRLTDRHVMFLLRKDNKGINELVMTA